jgi:isoleucyl-tRNA synthetase
MVLSTALFGKPAFKNLICNGLVLAEDGKKMSKSKNNYPSPKGLIDKYGAVCGAWLLALKKKKSMAITGRYMQ